MRMAKGAPTHGTLDYPESAFHSFRCIVRRTYHGWRAVKDRFFVVSHGCRPSLTSTPNTSLTHSSAHRSFATSFPDPVNILSIQHISDSSTSTTPATPVASSSKFKNIKSKKCRHRILNRHASS